MAGAGGQFDQVRAGVGRFQAHELAPVRTDVGHARGGRFARIPHHRGVGVAHRKVDAAAQARIDQAIAAAGAIATARATTCTRAGEQAIAAARVAPVVQGPVALLDVLVSIVVLVQEHTAGQTFDVHLGHVGDAEVVVQRFAETHRLGTGVGRGQALFQRAANAQLHAQAQRQLLQRWRLQLQDHAAVSLAPGGDQLPRQGPHEAVRRHVAALALAAEIRPAHGRAAADRRGQRRTQRRQPEHILLPLRCERQQLAAEQRHRRAGQGRIDQQGIQALELAQAQSGNWLHLHDSGIDGSRRLQSDRRRRQDEGGGGRWRGGARHGRGWRRLCLQQIQDAQPGTAIDGQSALLLLGGNRLAGGTADHAVGRADVMAAGQQQGLQLAPLRPRQARVVGGPGRGDAAAAAQAVGQGGDGQGVAFGGVVGIDRVVVAQHQERRSVAPGRQQHRAAHVRRRDRAAVDAGDAARDPVRKRPATGSPGQRGVETGRQLHFVAPRLARAPARAPQVVRGGGQRVGDAGHQVTATVAIAIHRDARIGAGHELGLAEGAGPGTGEVRIGQVAGGQQRQQGQELATEELLAPSLAGQGGQRHAQRALAGDPAVVAFHAPHRDHGFRIDPVFGGDARQQLAVRGQHRPAIGHALLVHQAGQVVPDRGGELGLGVEQRQHAAVRLQVGGQPRELGRIDAARGGLRLQRRQAALESGVLGLRQRCGQQQCQRQCPQPSPGCAADRPRRAGCGPPAAGGGIGVRDRSRRTHAANHLSAGRFR